MPVLVAEKVKTTNEAAVRIGKLAGAALVSAALSTGITTIFRNHISRMTSHVVFIVAVAAIGLLLHWTGLALDRFDAGLVLVLFLFEPVGRVLLHLETVPRNALLVVPVALVAAFFFGREDHSGNHVEAA
jgi:hypothetical protein